MRIGIVAPSCGLDRSIPDRLRALAPEHDFVIDDQCFLSDGHFAGPDQAREDALVVMANDPSVEAIWFARGGYGACRIAEAAIARFEAAARDKAYLGYSDAGFVLSGLYTHGIGRVAHGPMPSDLARDGGEAAVQRGLDWLINQTDYFDPVESNALHLCPPLVGGRQKYAAFNLTVLSQLLGTALQPDLTDHILMIEEVGEYMYRIDRSLFHITSNPGVRKVAGIKLGRCSLVPENNPDFVLSAEEIVQHWCARSGIAYLGAADIGHDVNNKVVPFG